MLRRQKFWIVWSPQGQNPPSFVHESSISAELEAERLAALHKGREFYVMESRFGRAVDDMHRVNYNDSDSVPF